MSGISNVRAVWSTKTPKAGDKVTVQVYWSGDSEYKGQKAASVYVDGYAGFSVFKRFSGSIYSNYATTEITIPLSWKGDVKGAWNVVFVSDTNMVTDTAYTPDEILKVTPAELDFQVTLSPANPTLKPGETVAISPIISGISPPYTATWKWTYHLQPMPQYDNKDLIADYQGQGYEFALCDVTVLKDGFPAKTVRGDTKVTGIKGTLDTVGVMISGIQPDVTVFNNATASALVTGVPQGAEVTYQWLVNGVNKGTTKDLSYNTTKPGIDKVQCIISVYAKNYDGVTISSPEMEIVIKKLSIDDITKSATFGDTWNWPGTAPLNNRLQTNWFFSYYNHTLGKTSYPSLNPLNKPKFKLDGVVAPEYGVYTNIDAFVQMVMYYQKISQIGMHVVDVDFDFLEDEYFEGGQYSGTLPVEIRKIPSMSLGGLLQIDGKYIDGGQYYIKAAPGEEISFSVANVFARYNQDALPDWKQEFIDLGKTGKFELIDKDGNVAVTADNNHVFTYTVPDEVKQLKGKIRHTITNASVFNPSLYVYEYDITIDIVTNPMVPMPKLTVTQTPVIARVGSPVKFKQTLTDVPAGANTSESNWFINQVASGSGTEINPTASLEMNTVRNNVFVVPSNGFDPAVLTADFVPDIRLKEWPVINLNLSPARTTIPWGEFLVAGFDVVGEEIMDDLTKLVEFKPTWYLDGNEIQTLAGDGSLSIRATHPGNHVIKASVLLTHPDYENGQKTVEQSFNMTTEKRDMAITLALLPNNPNIYVGETQKFTATVTGAPVDAITTYVWEIDGAVQTATQNTLDVTGDVKGTKVIKVTATTKAQDAADDVQSVQTNLVVKNKDFGPLQVYIDGPESANTNEEFMLEAYPSETLAGATYTYKWEDNSTDRKRKITETSIGAKIYSVTMDAKKAGYDDKSVTQQYEVDILDVPVIPDECPLIYVHPLPHRSTAYIWCGWWVMDAIEKLTWEGKDWKKATKDDSKYYCHLAVLAKMLDDYPEVDVQESRNGRIIHRSALEVGIIY